jgi:hypothetical protein
LTFVIIVPMMAPTFRLGWCLAKLARLLITTDKINIGSGHDIHTQSRGEELELELT